MMRSEFLKVAGRLAAIAALWALLGYGLIKYATTRSP